MNIYQYIYKIQQAGGVAVVFDMHGDFDPRLAQLAGVNMQDLYITQGMTEDQQAEVHEAFIRSGAVDAIFDMRNYT